MDLTYNGNMEELVHEWRKIMENGLDESSLLLSSSSSSSSSITIKQQQQQRQQPITTTTTTEAKVSSSSSSSSSGLQSTKVLVGRVFHKAQLKFSGEISDKYTDWCCGYIPLVYHYFIPLHQRLSLNLLMNQHSSSSSSSSFSWNETSFPYILDVGCGSGEFIQYLYSCLSPSSLSSPSSPRPLSPLSILTSTSTSTPTSLLSEEQSFIPHLFGVDISNGIIKKAIQKNQYKDIIFSRIEPYQKLTHLLNDVNSIHQDCNNNNNHNKENGIKYFDIITCNFVISGIVDLPTFFHTINEVLHPQHGVFYILTNNPLHFRGDKKFVSIRTQALSRRTTTNKTTNKITNKIINTNTNTNTTTTMEDILLNDKKNYNVPNDMDKINVEFYRWNESTPYVTFREYYRSLGTLIRLLQYVFMDCVITVDSFVYKNELYNSLMLPLLNLHMEEGSNYIHTHTHTQPPLSPSQQMHNLVDSSILYDPNKMQLERIHSPFILLVVKRNATNNPTNAT